MGIYNALYIGASGLSSFGEAVRVVGDNISNVNSLGFKSQNVNFSDVLSQTVGVSRSNIANQVGNGVRIGSITRDAAQGSLQNTTSPTDMAINGNGLFAMRDPATGQLSYTRAGAFILDKDFNLIDAQGNVVQGFPVDQVTNTASGNVGDITFANLAAQAQATTAVTAAVTLDSNATVLATGTVFDPNNPATFHYKTEVNVFDSLGQTHATSLQYTKVGQDSAGNTVWDWHASVDGGDLAGGTAGVATPIGGGSAAASTITPAVAAVADTTSGAFTVASTAAAAGTAVTNFQASAVGATYSIASDGAGLITVTSSVAGVSGTGTFAAGGTQAITLSDGTIVSVNYGATDVVGTAGTLAASTGGTAAVAAVVAAVGPQSIVFGPNGELVQENSPALTFNWSGAAPSTVSLDFGNAAGQGTLYPVNLADGGQGVTGTGLEATVQVAGSFATRQMTRDGFASGFLDKLETDSSGKIFGVFTNGQRRGLYQVALANFPNDAVLNHIGNNLLQESIASGTPVLGLPGAGGMGTISPFALEQSNVDLAAEFVKLIIIQRGYEANSKTILTTDQMLSSLMQVKR
ncbi:flagellar hook-basal body complex protein [Mariprofundus sp. EBB-1]|uniref:flagellar hook protein FlgE n=1 Tax=Mariprofundus sp. EBB-1 TaxID=2650971 RepID=UPI000EF18D5C|nr:flagellar hook-basal body complex protein [Mariprofundus sp. EBB-1]RLL51185.1 flagellar hook-basal body complex protein [Mariprofundus sp. EBB-1]